MVGQDRQPADAESDLVGGSAVAAESLAAGVGALDAEGAALAAGAVALGAAVSAGAGGSCFEQAKTVAARRNVAKRLLMACSLRAPGRRALVRRTRRPTPTDSVGSPP